MSSPCQQCGACCAHFRVSFYWSEAERTLGGLVPPELTEPLNPQRLMMQGTNARPPRCVALEGEVGVACACTIYPERPSACRELDPWDEAGRADPKCNRARAAHGLPPVTDRPDCAADAA